MSEIQLAPSEEWWVVELADKAPKDPEYFGPFATEDGAREWGRSTGRSERTIIRVQPVEDFERDEEAEP